MSRSGGSARWVLGLAVLALAAGCQRRPEPGAARVVSVWAHHGRARENEALRRVVSAFNRRHAGENLRVQIDFFPDRQYADKVSISAGSGRLPDVLEIDGPYVGPWAAEGLLQPIGQFVDEALRADFLPSILAQGTYRGKLYALGAFDSALVVYYNRDMIERAGLRPPEHVAEAWSWEQFLAALEAVRPYATVPLSLHMDEQSDEWLTYAFTPLVWSNGGRLIDQRRQRVQGVLDAPPVVEAISRWQALFGRGLAEATPTHPNPFAEGLAAFDWTGHWMLPSFEAAGGLRFGAMPLPRMGARQVSGSGSWCWGISRSCRDPAAAFKVLAWFVDPRQGVRPLVAANGAVPARKSAFRFFPEYQRMPRRLFREQLQQAARARPRTAVYLALTQELARALRDIALGAEVRAALAQAAGSVQRTLDRLRAGSAAGSG